MGFENIWNGRFDLHSALETKRYTVIGKTHERNTSDELVALLEQVVGSSPEHKEMRLISEKVAGIRKTLKAARATSLGRLRSGFPVSIRDPATQVGGSCVGKFLTSRRCYAE